MLQSICTGGWPGTDHFGAHDDIGRAGIARNGL
jgi:hypothetical protein